MGRSTSIIAAAAAAAAAAGVALASGGPPPSAPQPDPPANTVVATGTAKRHVVAPRHKTNGSIELALREARRRALPTALAAARSDATDIGAVADLRPGKIVGIRRDIAPLGGYGDEESGTVQPGRFCGRIYSGRRLVRRADGTAHRVARWRYGCRVPRFATARVTVTFAAQPG